MNRDLWRLADVGQLKQLQLGAPSASGRVDGLLDGSDGQVQVSAVCATREPAKVALIVTQPLRGSASLVDRMAGTIVLPK